MMFAINSKSQFPLPEENRGLYNPFRSKLANSQQSHDMLNFRQIGQKEFLNRVEFFILKQPSVKAPNRRQRLQTFSEQQKNSKRISQLERDKQLILTAMKRKIQYSNKTGKPIERPGEQLSQLPLAICDHDGNPLKGQKSYMTTSFESRYKASSQPVLISQLPYNWTPDCILVDAMFIINTTPLGSHKTFDDYAKFLLRRHVISQFYKGSVEVHLIFDNPGRLPNTPKYFEQTRRDKTREVPIEHYCDDIKGSNTIPQGKWHACLLSCHECKRRLVTYIAKYFLTTVAAYLRPEQTLYLAGCFEEELVDTAWFTCGNNKPQPQPTFKCTSEEADTRLWFHASKTIHHRIIIISPDTDVYHIGLPLRRVHTAHSMRIQSGLMRIDLRSH